MRVAIVRSDIQKVYLPDVENRSQRCFSSEPAGQSRYLSKPTDAALTALLQSGGILSAVGNNASATYNTTSNHTLRIRTSATAAFTVINVTSNLAATKIQIAADLNAAFLNAGLQVAATVIAANHIQLDTVSPNAGVGSYLELDTNANGSTLNVALDSGWPTVPPVLSGITLATFKAGVYPTAVTVDVSTSKLDSLSTFTSMQSTAKTAFYAAVADLIAPRLVDTGPVLLSFVYGDLSKFRSATFQPGGARIGLPAGIAAAIVTDDGVTPYTI